MDNYEVSCKEDIYHFGADDFDLDDGYLSIILEGKVMGMFAPGFWENFRIIECGEDGCLDCPSDKAYEDASRKAVEDSLASLKEIMKQMMKPKD